MCNVISGTNFYLQGDRTRLYTQNALSKVTYIHAHWSTFNQRNILNKTREQLSTNTTHRVHMNIEVVIRMVDGLEQPLHLSITSAVDRE